MKMFDRVRVKEDLPEFRLVAGMVGTIMDFNLGNDDVYYAFVELDEKYQTDDTDGEVRDAPLGAIEVIEPSPV